MKDERFMARINDKTSLDIYDTANLAEPKYKISAG